MKRKPVGREELFEQLAESFRALPKQLKTVFLLVRGNPGTGKTFTVRSVFPNSSYINCKLQATIQQRYSTPVVVFDEIDYYLLHRRAEIMTALYSLRNGRRKMLVVLVCNDLTARTTELLAPLGVQIIDVPDYTEAQLLEIARQIPELQNAANEASLRLIVKRAVETGRGDCRVLFNKVKQLNESEELTIGATAKIDYGGDLRLSYGEAYCLKSIYALKADGKQIVSKAKGAVAIGFSMHQIASQLTLLEFEYDDQLQIYQYIEHLETKELVDRRGDIIILRESGESVRTRRLVEEMTI